ncbi:MAG: hypothetical protein SPL89_06245 [Clostridia bacterium]|nr:hypothetical protein [Clostridia bacterium]
MKEIVLKRDGAFSVSGGQLVAGDTGAYALKIDMGEPTSGFTAMAVCQENGQYSTAYETSGTAISCTLLNSMYPEPGFITVRLAVSKGDAVLTVKEVVFEVRAANNDSEIAENESSNISNILTAVSDMKEAAKGLAEKSDTLSGYGITDAYTKTEIDGKIASVYKYKGSKRTFSELPPSAACVAGDVWNVESEVSRNFYGVKVVSVYAYGMGFDGEGGEMELTDVSAFTVGKTYQVCTEGKKILGTMTPTGISGNTLTFTYLTNSDYYGVFCDIAETKDSDYWNTWMEGTAVSINETYYFYSADFASTPPGTDKITKIINEGGTNFAWTGTAWDALGGTVDFSDYYTRAQVDGKIAAAIESALNTEV